MAALAASDLPVEKCELHKPPLEELAKVCTKLYHKQLNKKTETNNLFTKTLRYWRLDWRATLPRPQLRWWIVLI